MPDIERMVAEITDPQQLEIIRALIQEYGKKGAVVYLLKFYMDHKDK